MADKWPKTLKNGRIFDIMANMKHLRDKKLAILHCLGQEAFPLSLAEILEKLGGNFSARTVRRWMSDFVKEGLIKKIGQKKATKYQVVNKGQRLFQSVGLTSCFSSKSLQSLALVQRPLFERTPIMYQEEWLNSYIPNVTFYIPKSVRLQLFQAGKRLKREDPAGTYAHQIFNRLLIDLSYNSSRLEGNTYSLLDTQRLLLSGEGAEGKLDEEKIMILNHKEAIRYLVESATKIGISPETICTLHYLLSEGLVDSRFSGKIREHGVRIGSSSYIPFENPQKLRLLLENILQKAFLIEDPYEQSLFLLAHISYLQAFTDVNKRTARLSANIPLIKSNLVPLSFNDVSREDYISATLAIYELQDIHPLLDLYIFSYMRTCALYDATIKTIGFDEVRVRYRLQRRALVAEVILKKISFEDAASFVDLKSKDVIPEKDRLAFIEDVLQDLKDIDSSRLVGLGVTPDELEAWLYRK